VSTQEHSSPSRSASGQLTSSPGNGAGRLSGQLTSHLPLTRPLPTNPLLPASATPPAPSYGSASTPASGQAAFGGYGSGNGNGNGYGANGYGASAGSNGGYSGYGSASSYGSGSNNEGDYAPQSPAAGYYGTGASASTATSPVPNSTLLGAGATAAYGSPLSAYGGTASKPTSASSYPTPASSYPASSYGSAAGARNTQVYGNTLNNWSPALPVSPWSTPSAVRPVSGGMETETILKSDLKKLKRSRLKAWFWLFVWLGVFGYGGFKGWEIHREKMRELVTTKEQLETKEAEVAKLKAEGFEAASASAARAANQAEPAKPSAAGPTAATLKLTDDLKRVLARSPQVQVETRGNAVVVSVDGAALFSGREAEVSLGGYRALYNLNKVLKTVKDRKVSVTVPSIEIKRAKAWKLAAARAVSLGEFFTTDLGFDRSRVTVTAPAPRPLGRGIVKPGKVELVLDQV
jgi:flagellar motor protein MotB